MSPRLCLTKHSAQVGPAHEREFLLAFRKVVYQLTSRGPTAVAA